jgi:hypothetical protein
MQTPVNSLVEKVTRGQVFLRNLRFFRVIMIPPMLHTYIYIYGRIRET